MIDLDLHLARALVIDPNPMLRSVTATQMRDAGVSEVATCGRAQHARLMLERQTFDIVICNLEAEPTGQLSAQDLLDELRREQLLPFSTVFLIVTSHVTYAQAVEVAETDLDGFLVRPFSGAALMERVLEARNRKRELSGILSALESGKLELAVQRALTRFQERQPYWIFCGSVAAELLLRLKRPKDALLIFERIQAAHPVSWARVGMVRSEWAAGRMAKAKEALDALLQDDPQCADALDLQGRMRAERSDFPGALESYRAASRATPGCLLRAQHAGALAFCLGQRAEADEFLSRARSMGAGTRLFDALSLFLLALVYFDSQDAKRLDSCVKELDTYGKNFPQSPRLLRMARAAWALWLCRIGQPQDAAEVVHELALAVDHQDFDLEAAQVILSLWVRLPHDSVDTQKAQSFTHKVSMRFCSTRAITDFLVMIAMNQPKFCESLTQGHADIVAAIEEAVEGAAAGNAPRIIQQLIEQANVHRNGRFVEIASMLVKRYSAELGPERTHSLSEHATSLSGQYKVGATPIAGLQRTSRSPGALVLKS